MNYGPELNLINVILATTPLLVLLTSILVFRWSAPKAGAISWLSVIIISGLFFGADTKILAIGSAKGLSLSIFVLSIIWTSVLLYNVIDSLGGIDIIGKTMTKLVADPLAQALVVGWAFSGVMQGIAGFGVPVAVVAPLMVFMGFLPARAAAIVLVGHAWAVTFGSLGSSYFMIQQQTGIPGEEIGPHMAALFALPIIGTGFAVAHLQGGLESMRRGIPIILAMGITMAICLWITTLIGAPQIASIVAGLAGCTVGWIVVKTPLLPQKLTKAKLNSIRVVTSKLNFHMAFMPYYLLLIFSVIVQIPVVKELGNSLFWGLDYPATKTSLGHSVDEIQNYARITLIRHPAPLILLSLIISYLILSSKKLWQHKTEIKAARKTYDQCISTSVGIIAMVMMALIMTDTGMTVLLARTIATGTQETFPLISPYIGVLGTFMTGSNTNSNVMFGLLQYETAQALGITSITIASVQSIGGSLGSSIAPAKVLVGTAIVGLSEKKTDKDLYSEVMKRTLPYCLILVLLVGIQAWIIINLF